MKAPIYTFLLCSLAIVLLTGFWDEVSTHVLPHTIWGLYSRTFFEGLLSSVHGSMIDLFLVGILLYWFERRASKREANAIKESERRVIISRYREELSELALYSKDEIAAKTLAKLKSLMSLGIFNIDCPDIRLERLVTSKLKFSNANLPGAQLGKTIVKNFEAEDTALQGANCANAKLRNAKLSRVNISRVNFEGASLAGAILFRCDAKRTNFSHANLRSANFQDTDCDGANFTGADVRSTNFVGARNFSQDMLAGAKNAKYAKTN